jgi:hypothetical protein
MIVVVFLLYHRPNVVVMSGFLLITVSIMVVGVVIALPRHAFDQGFSSGSYISWRGCRPRVMAPLHSFTAEFPF